MTTLYALGSSMRGLSTFISDIRNCRTREQEEKRINKEFANIRGKLKEGSLSGYDKKKYVCKLLYIYLLGWDVDFGHMEAVNLISSNKYTEKQIGYLAVTLLISENDDLVRLVINSMRKDLEDSNEIHQCLSLQAIANLGGREIAESLTADVFKVLVSPKSVNFVKKKAALCLLRLYRKHPEMVPVSDWSAQIIEQLDDYDLGVNTSVASLLIALAQNHPDQFAPALTKSISKLYKIVIDKEYIPDNLYYTVPVPWLQCKLLRLIQCFPQTSDHSVNDKLKMCLRTIFTAANDTSRNIQQANAMNAVFLEAINVCIQYEPESDLIVQATKVLCGYLDSKEINMRYLGLETLATLTTFPECLDIIKKQQAAIFSALRDKDVSVRRRALDVLFGMCDTTNARPIVDELLQYLPTAEFVMKEELVLKTAILTEKFATEFTWYVDVILQLIATAGDNVSNEVWYRVVQIVVNNPSLHQYTAKHVFEAIKNASCHENAVKVAAYVLGEYADLIANDPGSSPAQMLNVLHSKFGLVSQSTRAIMLTTYIKFLNLFPEIKREILEILDKNRSVLDIELQQRSCEYFALAGLPTDDLLQVIFEQMPPFTERESALIQRLKKQAVESGNRHAPAGLSDRRARLAANSHTTAAPDKMSKQLSAGGNNNNNMDLLGLDSLVTPAPSTTPAQAGSGVSEQQLDKWYLPLLLKNSGVLYEDATIQVGLKSEYSGMRGKLSLFFGNKTNAPFMQFSAVCSDPTQSLQFTPITSMDSTLAAQAQAQQSYEVELKSCSTLSTTQRPHVSIQYQNGRLLTLPLPVAPTKFSEPIVFNATDFLARWRQIGGPPKESQTVVQGRMKWSADQLRSTLQGLGMAVLDQVDPNVNNIVFASILHHQLGKVGCLGRIECNFDQQMFRITLRTTQDQASASLLSVLSLILTNQE